MYHLRAWLTALATTFTSRLIIEPMDGLTLSPQNAASRKTFKANFCEKGLKQILRKRFKENFYENGLKKFYGKGLKKSFVKNGLKKSFVKNGLK